MRKNNSRSVSAKRRQKVIVSIRPSIVNNRFHNLSSTSVTRSFFNGSHNEVNTRLLTTIKNVRKNNKTLAQALQAMKMEVRMKNDQILDLMDEKLEIQAKLADSEHNCTFKLNHVQTGLESTLKLLMEQVGVIRDTMQVCATNEDQSVVENANDEELSKSKDDGMEQNCADEQLNNMPEVMNSRNVMSKKEDDLMLELENKQTSPADSQNRTKFNLTIINEESSASFTEENFEMDDPDPGTPLRDETADASLPTTDEVNDIKTNKTPFFVTKRGSRNKPISNPTNFLSPFDSPLDRSAKKINKQDIVPPVFVKEEIPDEVHYKFFQSKAKKQPEIEQDDEKENEDVYLPIYNISRADESNENIQPKVKKTRKKGKTAKKGKRKKKAESEKCALNAESVPSEECVPGSELAPQMESVADVHTPLANVQIKIEKASPMLETSWHRIEDEQLVSFNDATPESPVISNRIWKSESNILIDDKENFGGFTPSGETPVKEEPLNESNQNLNNSRPSRRAKPAVLVEPSLRKKMRR